MARPSTSTPVGPRSNTPFRKADRLKFPAALILVALPAFAAGQARTAAAAAPAAKCSACHEAVSLAGSVHAKLGCADCHKATPAPAAQRSDIPHAAKLPPPNCTETCHRES